MILSEGEIEFFRENGYLPARPLLEAKQVERLRSRFYFVLEGKSKKRLKRFGTSTGTRRMWSSRL